VSSTTFERTAPSANPAPAAQIAWYLAGMSGAFLVPFLFSSVLNLTHDVYYLVYFVASAGFLFAYTLATKTDVAAMFTRHWRWSLAIGVAAAIFVVMAVLKREDSTPHPHGLYFGFSIFWRGALYGVVDALMLSAFPGAVAYGLFQGRLGSVARRAGYAAVTLALVLAITATYHLGYKQFREDGVGAPETGNTIISLPVILTANPLGSLVAHASMHVTADVHAYETNVYLPPQTDAR
jgi:hypothetical protein